jgi:hypothetical protein
MNIILIANKNKQKKPTSASAIVSYELVLFEWGLLGNFVLHWWNSEEMLKMLQTADGMEVMGWVGTVSVVQMC